MNKLQLAVEALEPFAEATETTVYHNGCEIIPADGDLAPPLTWGDIRRAAQALAALKAPPQPSERREQIAQARRILIGHDATLRAIAPELADSVRAILALDPAPQEPVAAPVEPDGWRSIETAPQGRGSFLVHCLERQNTYVAAWRETDGEPVLCHFGGGGVRLMETPTKWMPLPPAPKAGEVG